MKRIAFVFGLLLSVTGANATMTAGNLRCEYRVSPLGIDVAQPRLSWTLQSDQRGDMQTAYHVLVASTPALLAANTGDLWDSGQVFTNAQNQIYYSGHALTNDQPVCWKVCVWDAANLASAWSTNGTWTMGLFNPTNWTAIWITPNTSATDVKSTLLRREFVAGSNLTRAVAHLCGLGQYEMSLNGVKAGQNFLSPAWSLYNKTVLYDTYDITSMIQVGTNVVGLMLGNGMYNIPTGSGRYTKFTGSYGPRQAIVQIRLEYSDGSAQVVGTDASWKWTNGPVTFNTIYGGEDYDARQEQIGWNVAGFNDASWPAVTVTGGPGGTLRGTGYASPPIQTNNTFYPAPALLGTVSTKVYDFGQNDAMIPTLTVHGSAGATVTLYPSERGNTNGTGSISQLVSPCYMTYTLKGSAASSPEIFTPRFFYIGSRYLKVVLSGTVTVDALTCSPVSSSSDVTGNFSCSKPLFNSIHSLVRWAQLNNSVSIFTDCPQREKLGWLEQDYLNGPSLRYESDYNALFTLMENNMADSQTSGLVPDIAPEYTIFGGGFRDSPEWGSACVQIPWQQYQFAGDTKLFQNYYGTMKGYVNYLTGKASGNIVNYGLGDWFDLGPNSPGAAQLTPVALTATATYYSDARTLSQMAQMLGNSADAVTYGLLATNILTAFNNQFFNSTGGYYSTASDTADAMPLALGMISGASATVVLNSLVQNIRSLGNAWTSGDIGYWYLLCALADNGRSDVVFDMINRTNAPGYCYILNQGATSMTESWTASTSDSQDHFMLGQIDEWFYSHLAGIQPDTNGPGFAKIIIKPVVVGDVTWAQAGYDSMRGMVSNHWILNGNQMTMDVTIPANSTAKIYLPLLGTPLAGVTVTESNLNIWQNGAATGGSSGVVYDQVETNSPLQNYLVWDVGSGNYQFQWLVAPTPTGLTANAGGGQISLNWNATVAATGYNLKRATNSGGPFTVVAAGITATNYTDTTVTNTTTYYYVISAVSALGESMNSFAASATPGMVPNFGFETPGVGTYQYGVTGGSWTFSPSSSAGGSGISANGSAFNSGNPVAPQGIQVAFLQGTGVISQPVSGFVVGTNYRLVFSAAQRNDIYTAQAGQTWNVTVNGDVIASFAPLESATNYDDYSVAFTPTNSTETLSFVGNNLNGGDNTIFIDNVRITLNQPVARYAFEGNAADSSGNGNDGMASDVAYVSGIVGALAAQFNGTDSYVVIPPSIATNFTVALWVKTTDTGGTGAQWWSGKGLVDGEVGGSVADWGTAVLNGKFALGVGNPDTTLVSSNSINDGAWHQVAATRDSTTGAMQVFVDGILQGGVTGPGGARTAPPVLRIGGIQTGTATGFLNGTIDEVRLYNWVLTATEIAALTNPPTGPASLTAAAGDGRVILNWSASTSATGYNLKRSTTNGGPYTLVAGGLTGLALTNAGLTDGVMYYFVATGISVAGESANSIQAAGRPVSAIPPQLDFNLDGGRLQFNWPTDHTGWRLEAQTNPDSMGLGTNWVTVSNSISTNLWLTTQNPTSGSVFYRLANP